jgi:large subunit ribosomal protein L4
VDGDVPKTKDALSVLLAATSQAGRLPAGVLVVAPADDELTWKSLRNARGVRVLATEQLNTRDVLVSEFVVFTEPALDAFIAKASAKPKEGQR